MVFVRFGYVIVVVLAAWKSSTADFIPTPIIQIQQGSLQGETLVSTVQQRPFYSFRGVPYATPPTGDLRFKEPQPAGTWDGVLNSTSDGTMCLQFISYAVPPFEGLILGSEDCLYLNVYTPYLPQSNETVQLLPVLVFFYGGGFGEGSDSFSMYGPHYLMDKDVLLVSPNYRLGPLGFLSTEDQASSGNYGLLDQVLAMKWIRDNIASFGGDPYRVTISGQSAGAAATLYHVLSPASAGLFHQAILESGSVLAPWALQLDPKKWASKLGAAVNCPTNDTSVLVDCLRGKPAVEIVNIAGSFNNGSWMALTFLPVVEDPSWGKFLTESPLQLLQSGNFAHVPIISGIVADEGISCYMDSTEYFETIDDHFFNDFMTTFLETCTHFQYNYVNLSYAMKDEYYTDIDLQNRSQVVRASDNFYSDLFANSENDMTVRLLTNQSVPVYMYVFQYPDCFMTNVSGQPEVPHTAELNYLYNASYILLNDGCREVSETLVELWSNFVTHGNPNPFNGSNVWTNTPPGEIHYLEITDQLIMRNEFLTQRMWFWNQYLPTIGGSQYF